MRKQNIAYRKQDHAFLAVADTTALQSAADGISSAVIRQRVDYWTYVYHKIDRDIDKLLDLLAA